MKSSLEGDTVRNKSSNCGGDGGNAPDSAPANDSGAGLVLCVDAAEARLMRKAFRHTAEYDAAIAAHFAAVTFAQARAAYMFAPASKP